MGSGQEFVFVSEGLDAHRGDGTGRAGSPVERFGGLLRLFNEMGQTGTITYSLRPSTFEEYYRANREQLTRALVLTLGNLELGRDAAAEAMTRTFENWSSVGAYTNPMGWTYRVGLNWARSRLRKYRREAPAGGHEPATHDAPSLDPRVDAAVERLGVKQRAVIVLRFYLDWSIPEIAGALGVPQGTVKSRLHRALATLERELGDS